MEKILVTGGAGYIGSVLVPMLLDDGHEVTIYDNLLHGGQGILPNFNRKNFTFIKGDVRDEQSLRRVLRKPDVVIHLAAIVGYPACKRDPQLARQVNRDASEFIGDTMSPEQLLIYASTGSNYGHVADGVCTEETPLRPISVYGQTKTAAEQYFLSGKPGNAVVYRFATAFGISPRMRLDLLINDFAYKVVKENYLLLYEAEFKRTFIEVGDIARGLRFAISHADVMKNQAFNVGSDDMNFSKRDIAEKLKRYRPDYVLHIADAGHDEDQRNYVVSYEKISKLGVMTTVSVDEGLDRLVRAMSVIEIPKPYSNA